MHGSALTTRFDYESSDVNVLLVVTELPFSRLDVLANALRDTGRALAAGRRRFSPLVLSEAQARGSADVFPAEFLELLQRRALLAGSDVLADLVVHPYNLRHQCEYELRSKLVGLRQAYLLSGGADGMAQRLLVQGAGGLAAVLRSIVILRGEPAPEDPTALVDAVARAYGVDAAALGAPFAARTVHAADAEEASRSRFAGFLAALEALVLAIDAFPGS
jgi:hypothetical protein